MSIATAASNTTARTQFLRGRNETYAYRRFGSGPALPLLCLQHFTGTLDNWDPAVTDPLATEREVILFDSAGVGRSTGKVPATVSGMASHGQTHGTHRKLLAARFSMAPQEQSTQAAARQGVTSSS